jgi:uncharacterized protein
MSSLQDQLLKAGLVSKNKAVQTNSAKRKKAKINRKHKIESIDEDKLAAEKLMAEQAEKARLLNQQKNQQAEQKAIQAQIKQLIQTNSQSLGKPQISFNFTDNNKIKKLEVSNQVHKHLSNGLLAIAKDDQQYHLVPSKVAEKIAQRSKQAIIPLNQPKETPDEDDPYADYQIPDDLMW